MSNLLTQCGSQRCSLEQLLTVPEPKQTKTYTPFKHYDFAVNVLTIASDLLKGYSFDGDSYVLSSDGQKMFGVLTYQKASSQDEDLKIATLGNFSTLIGKAKSRKTFLVSMLMAAALKGGRFQRRIVADFPKDKQRILVFDTKQGTNDVLRVQRRIAKLAEKDSEFMSKRMKVYALLALTPHERMENIEKMLAKHRRCGLVVIDGIRDLVSSINDED